MNSLASIGFIGGGQMAEAMIRGILASGLASPAKVVVAEPNPSRCDQLSRQYAVGCTADPQTLCSRCQVIVLAVKPQMATTVLSAYSPYLAEHHLVISIMAGVTLAALSQLLGGSRRLIRVMPNTPALVLAAATAFSANSLATAEDRELAGALFSAVGRCVEVPEEQLDAVTGLSGSGPGYIFTLIEALIDGKCADRRLSLFAYFSDDGRSRQHARHAGAVRGDEYHRRRRSPAIDELP